VRDVADEPKPMAGADHLGAEGREPLMRHHAGLEVADVVGRVVHELHVPDTPLMRLLEPLELHHEDVETFHVADDRRLPFPMRGLQIGRGERAAQAVLGDQFVHPRQAIEVVGVGQSRFGRAQRGEDPVGISALPRMGGSGKSARRATASDPASIPLARSPLGGACDLMPVVPPWVWTSTEMDFRRTSSAVFSRLGGLCRTDRSMPCSTSTAGARAIGRDRSNPCRPPENANRDAGARTIGQL
jgi:hypothetical protein